ncbi:MAG: hypothetical protein LBJ23_03795 [Tannerella sp.]|jgi:hypothetical protein|nr:hypothetical protein [Tannerella sp.]
MNKTNQIPGCRLVIAWLLCAVFLAPYTTKAFHVHHHGKGDAACTHSSGEGNDCPICHFALSLFVEAKALTIDDVSPFAVCEPAVYSGKMVFAVVSSRHLRGPPHV